MDTQSSELSYDLLVKQNTELLEAIKELQSTNEELQSRVDWFTRQVFGEKSEKHHSDKNLEPLPLFAQLEESCTESSPPETTEVKPHSGILD